MRDFRTSCINGLCNFITQALSMLVFGLALLGFYTVENLLFGVTLTAEVDDWCLFAGATTHRLFEEVL